MSHRSLVVLPDDTIHPILYGIETAQRSLLVKMFILSEPLLINAIIEARKRGVEVRVMLNPSRRNGDGLNEDASRLFTEAGIEVRESNPLFKITHEKSMVVDEHTAYVHSCNWDHRNFTETRDYAVITTHRHEVQEIIACFESDWYRNDFSPGETAHLVWCHGNGRTRIARFIDAARHTLFVQNDRYQDMVIIERLLRAARRGVKVHVMARPPHTLKKEKLVEGVGGLRVLQDVGIKVHQLKDLVLHAKMLLADGERAIIGSINLSPGSFDDRRELAIEVDDRPIIERLEGITHHDWKHSLPLDLSDEGIYEDLENRGDGGSEMLALHPLAGKKKKE